MAPKSLFCGETGIRQVIEEEKLKPEKMAFEG